MTELENRRFEEFVIWTHKNKFLDAIFKIWTVAFFTIPVWGSFLYSINPNVAACVIMAISPAWILYTIWKGRKVVRPAFRWMVYFIFIVIALIVFGLIYAFLWDSGVKP